MIDLNHTILYQMANFIVLIFILNALLYKPVLGIIEKRKKMLDESREEVTGLQKTAEQKMAEYEEKVRQAKMEAMGKKGDFLKEGTDKAKEIIDAVRGTIPQMMEQFNERMNKEITDARAVLQNQSQQLSVEIAEKVLGRRLQ